MSPWYSVNSQSCLSLCQTPRNLNDRVGCSKGQDLCSSTDGELINKALESLCWYSAGLGQRFRPMNLWQPLSSLKLLKCGVGWEERKESRLTWNLGCVSVSGTDKGFWEPEFWRGWVVQRLASARSPVIWFCCSTVLGSMAAQEMVPRCGAVLAWAWQSGSQVRGVWPVLQGLLTEIGSSWLF